MAVILNGLALQFFRGIGSETQCMGPFKEFNFFIGPNNSGKSTVLDFMCSHIPLPNGPIQPRSGHPDEYRGTPTGPIQFEVGFLPDSILQNASYPSMARLSEPAQKVALEKIIDSTTQDGLLWAKIDIAANGTNIFVPSVDINPLKSILTDREWAEWSSKIAGRASGFRENFLCVWNHFTKNEFQPPLEKPIFIPAKRNIGKNDDAFEDWSGKGLIPKLASIQNPSHEEQEKRKQFTKINNFVKNVTEKPEAEIEIPFDRKHILVRMDGKVLPLSSLGTGVHEVILIAAACTLNDKAIICLEEPESHLHPLLQRRLIDYLRSETDNQYFIATHSATFIDTPDAAIFQVTNDGAQTRVSHANLKSNKREICNELGYKASDILQTNAIVWVEGPSDRIYLNHWLKSIAPDLLEGLHFSVMFYGGRLLNHLTADDEHVGEFIDLLSLNQNSAILIDSDRDVKGARINTTKTRIKNEFEKAKAFFWVTKGREIENYVDRSVLQEKVKEVHPRLYEKALVTDLYDHALYFQRKTPKPGKTGRDKFIETDIDKVSVAKKVALENANLGILDLKVKINALADFLRDPNG